ncbi:MAG TPA: pectinesterase family protein [Opitutaceae bacterium]|nr:pectinesterase family protein [Opitutaceae bacterium]
MLAAAGFLAIGLVRAQDRVDRGAEPVVASIDPATLVYDYLVDGNLPEDDPAGKKFRTLQAAYAAAPAGTEEKPTVIGIRPNVYQLPGGAPRTPSLSITKNYITLLGLTNNRRTVVLADNRGLMQGAEDNGYILDVNATGFTAKNLTIVNYCNTDYEYPGDPSKNLTRRSDVITQAVALQAAGDKHVYENVALLSRLDTMFLRTTRSYFKNVFIEGTDDWVGGGQISVWEDCSLLYPTGRGVMSASNIVFLRCRFTAVRGMQLYKAEFRGAERPDTLIDCILPANSPLGSTAWVRGKAPPRPSVYTLTYHNRDSSGAAALVCDSTVGPPTFTYSRELSAEELVAFNPWNLLRAPPNGPPDDWDPAGVRDRYEPAGQGSLVHRMILTGGTGSIRTGGPGETIAAAVQPTRVSDAGVRWSTKSDLVSLSRTSGPDVLVTGRNTTSQAEWVEVQATAANGFHVTAHVHVEPKYTDPPAFVAEPFIDSPAKGVVHLSYRLDLGPHHDESLISWLVADDPGGGHSRLIAVSRGNEPLQTLPLTLGDVGKYIRAAIQPKHDLSEAGPAVSATLTKPIVASDVASSVISPNFRNFVPEPNPTFVDGRWTVTGTWTVVTGDDLANGYGLRPSTPAYLLLQRDGDWGDMEVNVTMTPEKTEGTGFSVPGSPSEVGPRNLHADVYIKYDPRTRNGYAVRIWRTTQSAAKCMFQLYRIQSGVGSPLNDRQVLTGVFKPTTRMTLKAVGSTLTVTASNDVDGETLSLEGKITPNSFGGAGVYWPGGSANVYSKVAVSSLPAAR